MKTMFRPVATGILSMSLVLAAGSAWAASKIESFGTSTVNGVVEVTPNGNRDPFIVQVFSAGAECLRIAVFSQGADMEATLVSPSGRVWQDDDGNGSLRPLIKAITDIRGYYTLHISQFSGAAVHASVRFTVQRLATTNALCIPATGPRIFVAPAMAQPKASTSFRSPRGGASD